MTEKEYIERDALPGKKKQGSYIDADFNTGWNACLNNIESIPAADVRPVVTCSECIYAPSGDGQGFDLKWPHDEWPESNPCPWKCEDGWYSYKPRPNFFCANGKREE